MRERLLCAAIPFIGALALNPLQGHAQSASPSPSPTPSLCSIMTLPDGTPANCDTGAEAPPSFLGVSGGNYNSVEVSISRNGAALNCCTGTLGALVENKGRKPFVLSSNHVLARDSSVHKAAKVNERIVQPGLVDLSCFQDPTDTVARLSQWAPIYFSRHDVNELDAAIARVVKAQASPGAVPTAGIDPEGESFNFPGRQIGPDLEVGQISATPFPFDKLEDGQPVMKMGRTSCLTSGVIDAFDAMGVVVYPPGCNVERSGTALFDHQILVFGETIGSPTGTACTFAEQGDAGALVVTLNQNFECPQAVGILFAAEPSAGTPPGPEQAGQIVVVNPLQTILSRFKVSLVGKRCTASDFAQQVDGFAALPEMNDKLRASIEQMRAIKEAHGRKLLEHPEVVAVGIGAGDSPDTSALNVYLQQDNQEVRNRILSEINGAGSVRFKHAASLRAL
jgi:hypothetical protein